MFKLKDILIALSLANLCLFRRWVNLIKYTPESYYNLPQYPTPTQFAALMLNICLLAVVFFSCITIARNKGSERLKLISRLMFLVTLLIPLNAIRMYLSIFTMQKIMSILSMSGVALLVILTAVALIYVIFRWYKKIVPMLVAGLLILFPLVPITFAQAIWFMLQDAPVEFNNKPSAPILVNPEMTGRKVVILIFDELDQRITFSERPQGIKLPELDRFRNQALYAENAYPPAGETLRSLPALITGEMVAKAKQTNANELMLTLADSGSTRPWSAMPNIFDRVRGMGMNSALVGWTHPYSRILGGDLAFSSHYMNTQDPNEGLLAIMLEQLRQMFETQKFAPWGKSMLVQYHINSYKNILHDALNVITDPRYNLVMVHMPIPHPFFIYDAKRGDFATFANWKPEGYLDNLALVDRTLGNIRHAMTKQGIWDSSSVIITADHRWRDSKQYDGKIDHRVPFLTKLNYQNSAIVNVRPFNTIVLGDLVVAILGGLLSTEDSLVVWLGQHTKDILPVELSK